MSSLNDLIQAKRTTFKNLSDRFNRCDPKGCRPIAIRLVTIAGEGRPATLVHPVDRLWKGVEASQIEPTPIVDSTPLDNPWFQYFVAKPASMSTEEDAAFKRWRVTAEAAGLELANCLRASEYSAPFPSSPLVLWVEHLSQASDRGFSLPVDRDGEGGIVFKDVLLASSHFANWLASSDWPLVQRVSDTVADTSKADKPSQKMNAGGSNPLVDAPVDVEAERPMLTYKWPNELAEDKWIYENIHSFSFDDLKVEHVMWCQSNGQNKKPLSRNSYKDRAERYREYHNFSKRRFKGACECPDCQPVSDT